MEQQEAVQVVIRFQICIFDILNTAKHPEFKQIVCCDSLSNLYLWHIKYSLIENEGWMCLLWFAFKFVSLTY